MRSQRWKIQLLHWICIFPMGPLKNRQPEQPILYIFSWFFASKTRDYPIASMSAATKTIDERCSCPVKSSIIIAGKIAESRCFVRYLNYPWKPLQAPHIFSLWVNNVTPCCVWYCARHNHWKRYKEPSGLFVLPRSKKHFLPNLLYLFLFLFATRIVKGLFTLNLYEKRRLKRTRERKKTWSPGFAWFCSWLRHVLHQKFSCVFVVCRIFCWTPPLSYVSTRIHICTRYKWDRGGGWLQWWRRISRANTPGVKTFHRR